MVLLQGDEGMRLDMNQDSIIWPGGLKKKPTGLMIPTHLKVLTILETPFVNGRQVEQPSDCQGPDEIVCPVYDTDNEQRKSKFLSAMVTIKSF